MKNYNVKRLKPHGFTMVELLVVMIIVGILVAVSYPSYRAWVLKSHRSDAMATLSQEQAILERCYAQTFVYNGACAALPGHPHTSPQGYYDITLTNRTATTYTLTATAIGNQTLDTQCLTMSIDEANQKTATDPICWNP